MVNDNEPTVRQLRPRTKGAGDDREKFLMDPRDNAAACRERAIADLKQASTMPTANARRIFESSAATWGARAAHLDRLEASFNARRASKCDEGTRSATDRLRSGMSAMGAASLMLRFWRFLQP